MTAACLIVRNEARDLPAWFAWHARIGITEFLVYDNSSDDGTLDVIRQAARLYDVSLIPWPTRSPRVQLDAYNDALTRVQAEWCAFIDADEYLMSTSGGQISDLLHGVRPDADAVLLNWCLFGSSGHVVPPADPVPLGYLCRAPVDASTVNGFVKSIVRPARTLRCLNPHAFQVEGMQVDANGNQASLDVEAGRLAGPIPTTPWRVNHYATRSRLDYEHRLARGRPGDGGGYPEDRWALWDRNDEHDMSAPVHYGAALREEMARWERVVEPMRVGEEL